MDGDSGSVQIKPIPLPRKSNRNFGSKEIKSIDSTSTTSRESSDINSNIDNLMEPKPTLNKFSNASSHSHQRIHSSKPVPLPRKFVRSNGSTTSSGGNVMPDLTNFSPTPQSGPGSLKSEDYDDDCDDDIDYESIPSHPNLQVQDAEGKRATINLFNRDVGDPFADFESSIKEQEPLSTITFRSPIEDLDEAARSRISISSMSSSATTASKSSTDYSDHYMEPPPARPIPVELTVAGGGKWDNHWNNMHTPYSFNTVPSKPKRSPHIALPRLSSLEEGRVLSTSPKSFLIRSLEKKTSLPANVPSSTTDSSDMCYEPISSYSSSIGNSTGSTKFNTISSISTKHAIKKSSGNLLKEGGNNSAPRDSSKMPINNNFNNRKRVTVPNIEKLPFNIQSSSLTNHTSLNVTEDESTPATRNFDPSAYDISDVHRYHNDGSPKRLSNSGVDTAVKRRSLSASLSGSPDLNRRSDTETERSSIILRRHSSGRSTSSSVGSGSSSSTGGRVSKRSSVKSKVHEYDEVAIEEGAVVLLSQSDSSSNGTLVNNSALSLTSRNSVVQEFDPLFDARGNHVGLGFPISETPLDLNDTQQHRYEYIDGEDDGTATGDDAGSSTTNEESPIPFSRGGTPLYLDNPGYSPSTPRSSRSSREIKTIDETYEPVLSPKEGISPKLSPKPRMGTRVLRKTEDLSQSGPILPAAPIPQIVTEDEQPRDSLPDSVNSTNLNAPGSLSVAGTGNGSQGNFFRKFSSKFRLNSIREEKDADKKPSESLLSAEETYYSLTTPCKKCSEPHPESTKCKFMPMYRQNIVYSSHLHKTSGLSKKDFSKKWAVLAKAKLTFYNEKSDVISEIPLDRFTVITKKNEHRVSQSQMDLKCFELGICGGKTSSFVFASASETERSAWMQKFIEVYTSSFPTNVMSNFDRAGWCFVKETVTSDWRPCWLILKERSLYYSYWKGEESFTMDLRKARSVVLSQKDGEYKCPYVDNGEVLTVDFICKLLYIQTESGKVTSNWEKVIKASSSFNGSEFHEMQLTLDNVPVTVDKCIDFVYAHGVLSEGIYRQSGSNTRITQLLQDFKNDAWSVQISHKDYSAHDVAGTLKRFFRTLPEPLVTVKLYDEWIKVASISSSDLKMQEYIKLLEQLPEINYNIMKRLMCHLYAVHELHEKNLMPLLNLAPIWGPTLMNVDTSKLAQSYEIACAECEVVKDLIENYHTLFRVDPQEIAKERLMQHALENFHLGSTKRKCSGDMKIWIYVWEKDEAVNPPINVTLTPTSTAHKIVQQICSVNKIMNTENLSLHEVALNLERPLHPSEKVIETVLRWSIWDTEERKSNYLILKKNTLYPSLVHYAKEAKHIMGELKYADSKSKSFRKYAFQFRQACLKYYKDSKSNSELGSWKIEDIVWYMGCEPKRNAPTRWTFTIVKRNYPFKRTKEEPYFGNVVVCASEDELQKWIGAMLIGEHPEGLNPIIV